MPDYARWRVILSSLHHLPVGEDRGDLIGALEIETEIETEIYFEIETEIEIYFEIETEIETDKTEIETETETCKTLLYC